MQRVNATLAKWDEHLADRQLPRELRRYVPLPAGVGVDDRKILRAVIVSALLDMEPTAEWQVWAYRHRN